MGLQHQTIPNEKPKRSRKAKDTPGIGHNAGGATEAQIKSIIDRILRLHEEADGIKNDIRDVYAEAKGNGYDKSALGVAVRVIRSREKNADKFDEQNALVDLYLSAYRGTGTPVATHMRARARADALPPHDPDTGEITEVSPAVTGSATAPAEPAADKGSAPNSETGNSEADGTAAETVSAATDAVAGPVAGSAPATHSNDFPDIPASLDRRRA